MKVEQLKWDSEFFEKKIGRIIFDKQQDLTQLLSDAEAESFNLVCVFTGADIVLPDALLAEFNGRLVDEKVLYSMEIKDAPLHPTEVVDYNDQQIHLDLEHLAYVSGQFSRFKLDTGFKTSDFCRMYKEWIVNSVTGKLADKVLVIRNEKNTIQGMVTLKSSERIGEIGLIAVSEDSQGRGYGQKLVVASKNWFYQRGIRTLDVPTQRANVAACKFYEKCGFKVKSVTNIYHFWL